MSINKITSTEIFSIAKIVGEEKAIEYVAKAGFSAWDFSMFGMCRWNWAKNCPYDIPHPLNSPNYISFAKQLKKVASDNGIYCNQSHAPFPSEEPIKFKYLFRAIECTAEVGGKICVIHPINLGSIQENIDLYEKLLPFAKQHNVKIATENMWDWDISKNQARFAMCGTTKSFTELLDAIQDDFFVACLDIGHAEMRGINTSAVEMINALENRLKALHIHDNDKWHDSHQIPFSMNIDFSLIAKTLKKINYAGDYTLEADCFLSNYTKENIFDGVKKLYDSVKKFSDMC